MAEAAFQMFAGASARARTLIAVVAALWAGAGAALAACNATADSNVESGNIGVRMTREACAAQDAEECYRSARVTLSVIQGKRNCPGMDPKWVAATSASLREIMRGLEIADPGLKRRIAREDARSEAADRAAAQALRGAAAEQPQRNACMGRIHAQCNAQCGGAVPCASACVGASSWQCYR
ncbi:MAG: hypothetical protein IPL88_05545 [Rhizobiales bacterium]|nr:hypothetical protein [Hyphomicrobiales bacterium]